MTPPRARRIASRVLWAALHGYEGHHLTERQRLGAWRRAMRGVVRGPSNARQMETTGAAMTLDLPGGYTVAIQPTGQSGPPGSTGMQGNVSAIWVRLSRPGWDSGWHEAARGLAETLDWWLLVESEADVEAAWRGSVGGVWPPRCDEVVR